MGIPYDNSKKLNYKKYNLAIKKFLTRNKTKIIFEPGRSIIGNTGSLISKIIYIKKNGKKKICNFRFWYEWLNETCFIWS